ncbi:MAG TPA: response regulator [Vicinamibacterales bacterium]|nr:response regulator [Vicinamibacterales bacterium]
MTSPLKVLVLEDQPFDAELIVHYLKQGGYDPAWHRVETEAEFLAALDPRLDVILADFNLPTFSVYRALELLKARNIRVPLIVVSGSIQEDTAIQVLHCGAADYLLKDRLARLGQAVQRVIDQRRLLDEKHTAEAALKESEERTRFALEAARVGVWEASLTTDTTRWSATAEALHGLSPGSFGGTFAAFLDRIHPDDRERVRTEAQRHHPDWTILYRTNWPDGTLHWISETGRTFFDESGTPIRAAGISMDVTERQHLEEENRQSQKVEAIGQLAGGIAHDFNNLLTAIQGYAELLCDDLGAESPHQRDLREIRMAADRAASLTRQLLAFSRRQILNPRLIDLRESLRGLESMLNRLIGEHITVTLRMADKLACVKADPGQIEQVILNLALNARDAMPDGGSLLLEVATVELDNAYGRRHISVLPGHYVMLAVSDTGVGMDSATQRRIFEPFFTTKPEGRGTGLGLSTVYGIVKQSGGYIWVYSEPGKGTTFKVYLPSVDEPADETSEAVVLDVLTGTETVLVVEDEPGVRELVRKVLERHGYVVLLAASPHEALETAQRHDGPIHLLATDVVMPEMSGQALARQVAGSRPQMRVLYMSGYTDNAIVHHGVLHPDTPFLQKPFTPQALARKVRMVLDS